MEDHDVTAEQEETLLRVYADLLALGDHPMPVVRAGARLALAEIAQVLNALDLRYELYTHTLSTGGAEQR